MCLKKKIHNINKGLLNNNYNNLKTEFMGQIAKAQ